MNVLILRKEIKKNEYRTPLIPSDCKKLVDAGFIIFVESSKDRCFPDGEYYENGCYIVDSMVDKNALIVGLKEFDYKNEKLFAFNHLYFSHCFKNQYGSDFILQKFKKNNGSILDYEYIVDKNGKRMIAFGFWAGFAGMSLGLFQYIQKINNLPNIQNIIPIYDYNRIIESLSNFDFKNLKIAIIGPNGRCGTGARFLLDKLKIPYSSFGKKDKKNNLENFNIIVNCIFLSPSANEIIIDNKSLDQFNNLKVIVDVSCDINAQNNPIRLHYPLTTFANPVFQINENIDIICIDNLPSYLPKDSSKEFSNKLVELLLNGGKIWSDLLNFYSKKIKEINLYDELD